MLEQIDFGCFSNVICDNTAALHVSVIVNKYGFAAQTAFLCEGRKKGSGQVSSVDW